MRTTEIYVFSAALAIALTIFTLFTALNVMAILVLFGFIMIALTLRSLEDEDKRKGVLPMLLMTGLYSIFSGNTAAFLIMYECRFRREIQLLLPAVSYALYAMLSVERDIPQIILRFVMLIAGASLLYLFESFICRYYDARNSVCKSVSVTALSEMYTKKLNQELVIKNFLADKNARLEERENISRSIHNSVGHSITAAIITLEAADMLFDKSPEMARDKIHTAKDRIRTGLDSIRHAVRVLDSEAVSISLADFLNEINTAADEFVMDTMRKIHMDIPENNDELYIPREHTEFLTGAFKELLSNSVKHGNADIFMVHIVADSNHIKLTVKDNGKSDFSAENAAERLREGFGLKKLKSYAEKCGGTAVFSNENGFKSEITLPFEGGHNE
ncbi:MAG: hypothetical protein IJB68_02330 [Ruminococcus sp.]|nr:hypothetical protein [Ruminococcus sp.]